jgi:hypothetical protein
VSLTSKKLAILGRIVGSMALWDRGDLALVASEYSYLLEIVRVRRVVQCTWNGTRAHMCRARARRVDCVAFGWPRASPCPVRLPRGRMQLATAPIRHRTATGRTTGRGMATTHMPPQMANVDRRSAPHLSWRSMCRQRVAVRTKWVPTMLQATTRLVLVPGKYHDASCVETQLENR